MKELVALDEPLRWPTDGTLFLAGGITGCRDWQAEAVELLAPVDGVVFNPRRPDFPIDNPHAAAEQIEWEWTWLRRAAVILWWFEEEQVQPIALFELGAYCVGQMRSKVVVGAHPGYPRALDVREQLRLSRPGMEVHGLLADTVKAAKLLLASR